MFNACSLLRRQKLVQFFFLKKYVISMYNDYTHIMKTDEEEKTHNK